MLPKHVRRVRSKGRDYYYFDTGKSVGEKKVYVRLPDLRSSDFGGSYAALLGHRNRRPAKAVLTVPALIDLYQKSPTYRALAAGTKRIYDIYLADLAWMLPTAPAAEVTRADLVVLMDKMADRPAAANMLIRIAGALYKWGGSRGHVQNTPSRGIELLPIGEHAPWPKPVLAAALIADDASVRLLTHLLYFTAQRLDDALKLRWTDIAGDRLEIVQGKTSKPLSIPLHGDLRAELARQRKTGILIAVNPATGTRFTAQGARKLLQTFAAKHGAKVVPHGLRKNAVNALLEAGCSVAETAAISGQTLQMVEHYAKGRNQAQLADAAVHRWEKAK